MYFMPFDDPFKDVRRGTRTRAHFMINEELRLSLQVYYSHYVINEGLSTIGDIS